MLDAVCESFTVIRKKRRQVLWHRTASGIVFGLYFVLLYIFTVTFEHAIELALIQVLPLVEIWFGDEMAAMTDVDLDRRFDLVVIKASAGDVLRIAGWLVLVLCAAAFMLGRLLYA